MQDQAVEITPSKWLVTASTKGIQEYILRSPKLKDIMGASTLVDSAPTELLQATIEAGGFDVQILSQTAGSVRAFFDAETQAKQFARIWSVLLDFYAPGIEVTLAVVACTDSPAKAIGDAETKLTAHRNFQRISMPVPGPLVKRNPRSSLPATGRQSQKDEEPELVDREIEAKHAALLIRKGRDSLMNRLAPESPEGSELVWPVDLSQLTEESRNQIAVIHADGNGLGQRVMDMVSSLRLNESKAEETAEAYRAFSKAISHAIDTSVQRGLEWVIHQRVVEEADSSGLDKEDRRSRKLLIPFRPIVCAGEDITVIIAARFAIPFTKLLLETFEQESAQQLKALPTGQLPGLTACAGVVFCKAAYPFSRAHELAATMCDQAKHATARSRSAITFARVKASQVASDNYEDWMAQEYSGADSGRLTMCPYTVGEFDTAGPATGSGSDLPHLAHLAQLVSSLSKMPKGSLRELATLAYGNRETMNRTANRIGELLQFSSRDSDRSLLEDVKINLTRLTGQQGAELAARLWQPRSDGTEQTPLLDALELVPYSRELSNSFADTHNTQP